MFEYTVKEYISSATTIKARIVSIEALIDAMILTMADVVVNSGTMSYRLDDGQMNVNTDYRSVEDVQKGIVGLERMKQMYKNQYNV